MKLQIEISDEHVLEVDVPPGFPRPHAMDLRYSVASVQELGARLDELGGLENFYLSESGTASAMRFAVPIRCDGEEAGSACVHVRVKEEPAPEPKPGPLAGLIAEQKERRRQEAERELEAERESEAIS